MAWWGGTTRGSVKYYRVQGATFVVESAMVSGEGNHNHICWRDFDADFARDAGFFAKHVRADMAADAGALATVAPTAKDLAR